MINNMKIICVILARGGSKELENKNIFPIHNKPLIRYTIDHCISSKYIDDIYVSTDNLNIKKEVEKYSQCHLINRPKYLSGDLVSSEKCILHAIKNVNKKYEVIVFPQNTHPIRRRGLVDTCLETMSFNNNDSLLTVRQFSPFFLHLNSSGKVFFNNRTKIINRKMRQQFTKEDLFYYDVGNMYVITTMSFLKRKDRIGYNPYMFVVQDKECIDIHNIHDIEMTEFLLKGDKNV